MRLNDIKDNPGSRKPKKRVGRGIGSGLGKTCGKGHKGQKARSGGAKRYFEGGQMPVYRRLPKRGFKNIRKAQFALVNIDQLQMAVDNNLLNESDKIDTETLLRLGFIRRELDGVKLLGRGEITKPLHLVVNGASASATAAVEKAGGSVTVLSPNVRNNETSSDTE